jgi:hypothetical protein
MINKGKPLEKRHDREREQQCQDIVGPRQKAEKRPRVAERRWRELEKLRLGGRTRDLGDCAPKGDKFAADAFKVAVSVPGEGKGRTRVLTPGR